MKPPRGASPEHLAKTAAAKARAEALEGAENVVAPNDTAMAERRANFMRGVGQLRAAGYRISDREADEMFMREMARQERGGFPATGGLTTN